MKKILILTLCTLFSVAAFAQKKGNSTDDYNYRKALELYDEKHDAGGALELLNKQLAETPDYVDALFLRARIHEDSREFRLALLDINHAIKVNKPKSTGFPMSRLYFWQGYLYIVFEDKDKGLAAMKPSCQLAEKDDREGLQDLLFHYADALYHFDYFAEADAVYDQMLANDEGDVAAIVGKARLMHNRERYAEAAELCEKAIRFDRNYSDSYKVALMAYKKSGETDKAIDNAVEWLDLEYDAFDEDLFKLCASHQNYAVAKLKEKMRTSENKERLHYAILRVYESAGDYEQAIRGYDEMEKEYGKSSYIYSQRANCYDEYCLWEKAISDYKASLEMSDNPHLYGTLGDCYRSAGQYEQAIEAYSSYIESVPTSHYGYYARGWCYELMGDDAKAMEDYELGIDIDKSYPYIFLMRGEQYLKRGEKEKADADFETVLQLDTTVDNSSCRQYALHFLGRDDDAQEWMEKIIAENPDEPGNWYDQTCLFCQMGRYDDAVEALRKCIEKGYCKLPHIQHDNDLDPIRDREDFKQLTDSLSIKMEERQKAFGNASEGQGEPIISEVAIVRHSGGTFTVPCEINGLPLEMIFDTGASDVTISSVEANFMLKNNYLSTKDVKGKKYYQIADGNISEGTVIILKEVKVGDAVLKNVDASVVNNQKAPLLLGQSVMERFGIITIDNINNKLLIKH